MDKKEIESIVDAGINSIYKRIQDVIGVKSGDEASMYHSGEGDRLQEELNVFFAKYVDWETRSSFRGRLEEARERASNQMKWFHEHGGDKPDGAITFEFEGVEILDPFHSSDGRFEVDPVEYYGVHFMQSKWMKEPPSPEVNKTQKSFCVVSCEEMTQQVWEDWIMAESYSEAEQKVADLRDYATVCYSVELSSRIETLKAMVRDAEAATPESLKASWLNIVHENDKKLCIKCGDLIEEPVLPEGEDEKCEDCSDPE